MTNDCDHKFIDSKYCLKCGWSPAMLDIVRVETEPPDYQADVVRGVGWFRMPSEEAMNEVRKDPPAHAAWQDVEQVLAQEPNLHVLKILIADARAADARQIAALRAEVAELHDIVSGYQAMTDPEQPEFVDLNKRAWNVLKEDGGDHTICRALQAAEAQLAALRAENERFRTHFPQTVEEAKDQLLAKFATETNADVVIAALTEAATSRWGIIQRLTVQCHEWEQQNDQLQGDYNRCDEKRNDWLIRAMKAEAQLTALQAELKIADDCYRVQGEELLRHIRQVEALQAEQAQWQQEAMRYLRHEPDCHISIARMTLFDPACHANGLCSCGLVQLAALTAQQEKPVE